MNKPELKEGEIYVGAIVGANGHGHHLILLPEQPKERMTWKEAMEAFLAEHDAIKHKELLAIHEVVQCIGCVKEVLPTDSVTVAGVKMMAIRLNEREIDHE